MTVRSSGPIATNAPSYNAGLCEKGEERQENEKISPNKPMLNRTASNRTKLRISQHKQNEGQNMPWSFRRTQFAQKKTPLSTNPSMLPLVRILDATNNRKANASDVAAKTACDTSQPKANVKSEGRNVAFT